MDDDGNEGWTNSNLSACLFRGRTSAITSEWISSRLKEGVCNCSVLAELNVGRLHLYCSPFPFEHSVLTQLFYITMFASLILLSCAGNLAVVWIVLRHEKMRTVTNYYLLNLAISDLSITVLNTGFSGSYNLYYNWIFSSFHCAFNNLMGITPICASVFTMMVMSIDRYLAICYPLRHRPGRGKTVTIIILIWLLALLCGLPAFFTSSIESNFFIDDTNEADVSVFEDRVCLADKFPDGDSRTSLLFNLYNNSLVIMQYLLPLIVLSFTYGRVAHELRRHVDIGDTRHIESVKAKRKASNMLALVVFSFIFMWLPYNLYFLFLSDFLQELVDMDIILHLYIFIYWLGMSSCVANPIIYYFMNERFRLGFRYAFRWLPCIRINKDDYENTFAVGVNFSCPTPKFSATNTIFSSTALHHKKASLRQQYSCRAHVPTYV